MIFIYTDSLISIFNSEDNINLAGIAKIGLRLYFIGFVFAGFNIVITGFLSAIQKPNIAFLVSITRGFLAIVPLAFILAKLFGMGGVWISFLCAEVIIAIISIFSMVKLIKSNFSLSGITFINN